MKFKVPFGEMLLFELQIFRKGENKMKGDFFERIFLRF